ncbi:MAG: hypothetical protein PHE17_00510 [Thiothrix sp.]|uniref:sensor histidine kinase n=1 Tax=Thiothrix sp. TaxID=1032 RepID=UPI002631F9F9|nr:hypothetical protein [Thiothrix sp.]MDD5391474.1 hypothetical protein [Thiothrix sp.]
MNWSLPKTFITPANVLLAVLLFVTVAQITGIYLLMQTPWTGINAVTGTLPDTVVVASLDADSPATGKLPVGAVLTGVQTPQGLLKLAPLLYDFPPLSPATFAQLDAFYQRQADLHRAFTDPAGVTFVTLSGENVVLTPLTYTPLSALPLVFWLLNAINLISPLVGVLVWTYRPHQQASALLLMHGLFYYAFVIGGVCVVASEFYLPPDILRQALLLQVVGIGIAAPLMVIILCYAPSPLMRGNGLLWLTLGGSALAIANYHYRWFESPGHMYYSQHPLIYISAATAIILQWRRTRQQPVERAALLVLALSFMLPSTLIVAIHVLPILFGKLPLVGNTSILMLFLLIAVGLAVGILRYRLFDIEFWWLKSLLWLLGGCLVAAIDLSVTALFQLSDSYALGVSVMIAGFLYFPLRQWLLGKVIPAEKQNLQDFLPAFSSSLSDAVSQDTFEQRWLESLQQRFYPLHLEHLPEPVPHTQLSDNGLHLQVPSLDNTHAYRLSGKQRAARLFNNTDIKNTESLLTVARMASNASEMRQQTIMEERRRIMHDLHDSLGSKLLTLTHQLPDPHHKESAKQALMTLRDTIRLSLKTTPLRLEDHLADWRVEIAERADASGTHLHWQQAGSTDEHALTPKLVLEITQLLRETVSNALKHAAPTQLSLRFHVDASTLRILVGNDGQISDPATWQAGTGLGSIQTRIARLGGDVTFQLRAKPKPHNRVVLRIPLI